MKTRHQKLSRSLRLVLLSDTHEQHAEVEVPPGDILIHAGDFTMFSRNLRSIVDFNDWLAALPHRWKLVCPGNHETLLQTNPENRSLVSNATVLVNEGVRLAGLRIWASPVTPVGPAFGMSSPEERRRLYDTIPSDTDVLISHGPPFGILDGPSASGHHQGDPMLLDAAMRVRPRLHIFGHVHLDRRSPRILETEHTVFANASLLGPEGAIDKPPLVLTIARK